MPQEKICLASDNFTPTHPLIIEAILEANQGYAAPYGSDPWTLRAEETIQKIFQTDPKVLILPTGTSSNVLALKIACQRYESVICTDIAHIQHQESGSAESIVGCKLLIVPHVNGKITAANILRKLSCEKAFGKHSTSPRVVSISQPTEVGTVYSLEELKELASLCKEENLLFHIDGSRFYNAAAFLQIPLYKMIEGISLDLLSLGGTKNGLMCAEALLIFNPTLRKGADHLHKQNLCLLSKMRFISAQYITFFQTELWLTLAQHANQKAQEIASCIAKKTQLSLSYPVETNQIFFTAPPYIIPIIQDKILCYLWDSEKHEIRLITSWCTTPQEIQMAQNHFINL